MKNEEICANRASPRSRFTSRYESIARDYKIAHSRVVISTTPKTLKTHHPFNNTIVLENSGSVLKKMQTPPRPRPTDPTAPPVCPSAPRKRRTHIRRLFANGRTWVNPPHYNDHDADSDVQDNNNNNMIVCSDCLDITSGTYGRMFYHDGQ